MTRADVAKMFYMVKAAYPRFCKDYGEAEIRNYIDAWCLVFQDIEPEQGFAGLKAYMSTENTGYPPSPGQIKNCIYSLQPDRIPNDLEAWTLVDRAVRNSNYHSEEEFNKLPPIVRRAVRNPARLREWAKMDLETYQSVEQSQFLRTYRAEVAREREVMKMPQDIRPKLEMLEAPEHLIETKATHERKAAPDELQAMIDKLKGETA